ncbi:MAG: hypothetical protein K6G06_05235 [Butyrivibrio sp.]|nr:hypothetical protein [Butyrivibrio sp.]
MENKMGYRDDTLFLDIEGLSTSKTDPFDVVMTEILYCGKYEICIFILLYYSDVLSLRDYRLLNELIKIIKTIGFPVMDYDKKEQLKRIIAKLISGCDRCVWLCAAPGDIYDYYINGYIPKAEKVSSGFTDTCPDYEKKRMLSKEEYAEKYVTSVNLPENMVFLCDLGEAGALLAYKEDGDNLT